MAQQLSPWLEGAYGWSFGEGGWNTGMDQNLLKFSFLFDRNVDSVVTSLPAAANGQAHYLTTDNRLYFAVGTTYFSCPVPKWFTIYVRTTGQTHQFNGTSLVQIDTPAQLDARLDAVELTVASLGTAAFEDIEFFATQSELDVATATAASYTDMLKADLVNSSDPTKGAKLIGFDSNTLDQQIKSKINRVVGSITSLKALSKDKYTQAVVTGYYVAGDGGGGIYYLDAADTTSADNGGTIIVATDGGRWKLSYTATLSVKQFGAKGDGVTDDYPAFSQAVAWLNAQRGGDLFVPYSSGPYMLSAGLLATTPILFLGSTRGDDSSNTNGGGPTTARPVIMASAVMSALLTIKSPTIGNTLWGGGADGIEWNGNALAVRGVWFDNTKYSLFDGKVRDVTFAGVQVDSTNGSTANFSMKNHVRSLEFVWGTAAACQNADGLHLGGNGSTVPATQQFIGDVAGLVYNGSLVSIAETDNAQFRSVHGVVQSGGTGKALKIINAGAQGSHHTHIEYCVGPVLLDNGLIGTNILNYNSEGGGITQSAGTSSWDGNLIDYTTGRRYVSHTHKLREKLSIHSGAFVASGVTVVEFAYQWPALTFSATATSKVSAIVVKPYDWDNGVIEGIEIVIGTNGVNGGNYRLQLTCSTGVTSTPVVTPEKSMLLTQPSLTQYVPTEVTFTFSPELAFTRNDHVFLTIARLGGDGADTNTDELLILGARILYRSTGPDSPGSGTYTIPTWS